MEGRKDEWMEERRDELSRKGGTNGRKRNRTIVVRKEGRMDGRKEERTEERMDGRKEERT